MINLLHFRVLLMEATSLFVWGAFHEVYWQADMD